MVDTGRQSRSNGCDLLANIDHQSDKKNIDRVRDRRWNIPLVCRYRHRCTDRHRLENTVKSDRSCRDDDIEWERNLNDTHWRWSTNNREKVITFDQGWNMWTSIDPGHHCLSIDGLFTDEQWQKIEIWRSVLIGRIDFPQDNSWNCLLIAIIVDRSRKMFVHLLIGWWLKTLMNRSMSYWLLRNFRASVWITIMFSSIFKHQSPIWRKLMDYHSFRIWFSPSSDRYPHYLSPHGNPNFGRKGKLERKAIVIDHQ